MSTIGRPAGRVGWAGESAVLAAVSVALLLMGVLHVLGSTVVDPVSETISDYVAVPGGYTLLGMSTMAMAVAGVLLIGGVRAAQLPRARTVTGLLVVWSAALVVVAVFPTNDPGTPVTVSAWVHRWGGAVMFAVLPVIVALVARRAAAAEHWAPAAPALRVWAWIGGACTGVFLLSQIPVGFGLGPALPWIGLMQRLLFGLVMVLVAVLARAVQVAVGTVPVTLPAPSTEYGGAV
jgi:hypothetical protein